MLSVQSVAARVFGLLLGWVAAVALWLALRGAAVQDAPSYAATPLEMMSAEVIVQGTPENSNRFWLQKSETFAIEWEASAAPNFELDLVMEDQDGDLCNSATTPACDIPNESIKNAETDQRGFVTFTPAFSNRPMAIRVTNNAVGNLTISLFLHRDTR